MEVHVELSRSDKLNLILLFLTLGPTVFYCKRHNTLCMPISIFDQRRSEIANSEDNAYA